MAEIYKINHLTYEDSAVKQKIFCFAGKNKNLESIFSETERNYIEEKNIEIALIDSFIYPDDTIDILKRKIMRYVTKISFGEIGFNPFEIVIGVSIKSSTLFVEAMDR